MEELSDLGDEYGGPVNVVKLDGRSFYVPVGVTLRGEPLEAVAEVDAIARQIRVLQRDLIGAVQYARDVNVSWANIGFYLGTTGEAARQRFGGSVEPPSRRRRKKGSR